VHFAEIFQKLSSSFQHFESWRTIYSYFN